MDFVRFLILEDLYTVNALHVILGIIFAVPGF